MIFRKWAAITAIAAALEQKVWIKTSSELYPNIYAFIVGHPGVGKTRVVRAAKNLLIELPDFHLAPTSVTGASLVDALVESKRLIPQLPADPLDYNSMSIIADELGTFMHQYDDEMVGLLSAFYDPDPYGQNRRGKDIKIKIKKPQLSILCGTTPSNLLKFIPEGAWDQGFTSRIMMIFSDERIIADDFATEERKPPGDLLHDLKIINGTIGEFKVTEDYRTAVNNWRNLGEPDVPNHPKLIHYNTRRRAHLYKLSMVSAIDRGNVLLLTKDDFNRALGWLLEAELYMAEIFKAGAVGADAQAMEEIKHFVMIAKQGAPVSEHLIVNFARERVPAHSVLRVLEIMEKSRMIRAVKVDPKTGLRMYAVQTGH